MKATKLVRAIATAALALASLHAAAGIGTNAGFSQANIAVTDLTPGDGDSAGFSVVASRAAYYQEISGTDVGPWPTSWSGNVSTEGAWNVGNSLSSGHVTSSGTGEIGGINVAADVEIQPDAAVATRSEASQVVELLVAPHTLLTFSGVFNADVEQPGSARSINAVARERISLNGFTGASYDRSFVLSPDAPVAAPFWFAIANTGDEAMTLHMFLEVSTFANYSHQTSPVPEPSTYAMLLAGVCAVAALRRRRP